MREPGEFVGHLCSLHAHCGSSDRCRFGTDKNRGAGTLDVFGAEGPCLGFWLTFSGSLLGWESQAAAHLPRGCGA